MTSGAKENSVHVAVVQAGAVPFDTDACIDKAVRLIGEAAATGARVILFPAISILKLMLSAATRGLARLMASSVAPF